MSKQASRAKPNVLLILTDQQKATSLGLYGNEHARTPALDSLAASGVLVEQAVCNYPACTPGRAALLCGRYPHTIGVRANHLHLPEYELHLPRVLAAAGYTVGLIGKNHSIPDGSFFSQYRLGELAMRQFDRAPRQPAVESELQEQGKLADHRYLFDEWYPAGHFGPDGPQFASLREFASQPRYWRSYAGTGTIPRPADECTSAVLGSRAADFIRAKSGGDRPWFLWLSFPDPHNPYIAPEPYASMYDPDSVDVPPEDSLVGKPERHHITRVMSGMSEWREDVIRKAVAMQYGQITAIDDAIAQVLRALDQTGERDNTIVVFTSDHGGYLGEHGGWHKALAFFEPLIRIPLVISFPAHLRQHVLSDGFVEQVDILPTVLELAGVGLPPGVQGRSVVAALSGSTGAARPLAFSEGGEKGEPVTWSDLPFRPDGPLDERYLGWDGFQEAWVGQGKMVRDLRWKYVWWANGDEEMYDLATDPDELVNLMAGEASPDDRARRDRFRDALLQWSIGTEDQLAPHNFNVWLEDAVASRLPF